MRCVVKGALQQTCSDLQRCNTASATSSCTASVLEHHFATHCTVNIRVMKFSSVESPARALHNAVMGQTFAAPLHNADSAIWVSSSSNIYQPKVIAIYKALLLLVLRILQIIYTNCSNLHFFHHHPVAE